MLFQVSFYFLVHWVLKRNKDFLWIAEMKWFRDPAAKIRIQYGENTFKMVMISSFIIKRNLESTVKITTKNDFISM